MPYFPGKSRIGIITTARSITKGLDMKDFGEYHYVDESEVVERRTFAITWRKRKQVCQAALKTPPPLERGQDSPRRLILLSSQYQVLKNTEPIPHAAFHLFWPSICQSLTSSPSPRRKELPKHRWTGPPH